MSSHASSGPAPSPYLARSSGSTRPAMPWAMRAGFANIGPEIGQAAADIHIVEHSHQRNLGDVAAICEGQRSARRLRQTIADNVLDCKKCNSRCSFRSCNIHCAVQYHTCLLGILSQNFHGPPSGGPFFWPFPAQNLTFLVEKYDVVRIGSGRISPVPGFVFRIAALRR